MEILARETDTGLARMLDSYDAPAILVTPDYHILATNDLYREAFGQIDPSGLLVEEDVTETAEALLPRIPGRLADLRKMVAGNSCPEVAIGTHCNKPYSCDLRPQCWAFLPDYPVTDLYRDAKGRGWDYLDAGVTALTEIPDPDTLSAKQRI